MFVFGRIATPPIAIRDGSEKQNPISQSCHRKYQITSNALWIAGINAGLICAR
jgi:hypothetical protein